MFSTTWHTSPREFDVRHDVNVAIPVSDGITIDADIVRPVSDGRHPVILSVHAYAKADQFAPIKPTGMNVERGHMEAGDCNFFARRGYVHVIANVRGTGRSGGNFGNLDARSIQDIAEVIEWLARQSWSSGRVGMFGISYFSIVQQRVATLAPPSLKALFAPYGWTDSYRDRYYRGGILAHSFMKSWLPTLDNPQLEAGARDAASEADRTKAKDALLRDEEIQAVPYLVAALKAPDEGANRVLLDVLVHPLDGAYYRERSVDYGTGPSVPAYLGACWGIYGLHLPGAFRSWENWQGPRRLTIGPPLYFDRPFHQCQYEALRWFDHWLKDVDTGLLDEPPVRVFLDGSGEWREGHEWPLPQTRWTPLYLHEDGLLLEREHWPDEGHTSFEDSRFGRGHLDFRTPCAVETTEICGPIALDLHASTTGVELLLFASLWLIDTDGRERLLTRGWLRGSQRKLDTQRSRPWQPVHAHDERQPLEPGKIYLFNIEIRPYGLELRPGQALKLRLACSDTEPPENFLHVMGAGSLVRQSAARITVHHNETCPSTLWLPVIKGNRLGFFYSGGQLPSPQSHG